jgi:hypothetical protein
MEPFSDFFLISKPRINVFFQVIHFLVLENYFFKQKMISLKEIEFFR